MLATSAMAAPLMQGSLVHKVARRQDAPITVSLEVQATEEGVEIAEKTIQEGVRIDVTFQLTKPPVCADSVAASTGCTVRVVLENTRPDEVALSKCYVEWNTLDGPDAWKVPKVVEITTVEDFVDDGQKVIVIATQPTESNTEYYNGVNLPDIKIVTPDKGTSECSSTTDPNYRQFDGDNFIINTAGTFQLWKAPQRDWEVQSRVNAQGFNCGIALRDGCDRVVFDRCSGTFSMRKYFNPTGDPDETPIISREGGSTWVVTSRKSGAQVRVVQRVKINRVGTQSCGWSGCRISYHTTRKDWLDVHMKAPGSDYGWYDSATAEQTIPRTTGVCGAWTSNRNDDKIPQNGRTPVASSPFVSSWSVAGKSLFDETPGLTTGTCETVKPPVVVEPKECSVTPRRIQKPIISVFDIEDITDMLKNTIEGEDDDDEAVYIFDNEEMPEILRTDEFSQEQKAFCTQAMTGTSFAKDCAATEHRTTRPSTNSLEGVNGVDFGKDYIDLVPFIQACHNDIMAQAPACAGTDEVCKDGDLNDLDVMRDVLAKDTYESLEEHCIELMAKDDKYSKYCPAEDIAAGKCEMNPNCKSATTGISCCIGACSLGLTAELAQAVKSKCPNSCGIINADNIPEDGSGGTCTLDGATGKNVCECFDPTSFGGPDCSIVVGGIRPAISHLSPYGCATNGKKACPFDVLVLADEDVTAFIQSEDITCEVNGELTGGTFIDSTRIRCPLAASTHRGSSDVDFHKVRVSQDGETFSHFLHFCYHNSECTTCDLDGTAGVKEGSCAIDGQCHLHGNAPSDDHGKCKVCDTGHSQTSWKFKYEHQDCAPTLRDSSTIKVGEKHPLHTVINAGSPLTTKLNLFTQGDEVNTPKFYFTEPSTVFELEEDTGFIKVIDILNFEAKKSYTLGVKVLQGGLVREGENSVVNIELFDQDEGAVFVRAPYSATVVENSLVGQLTIFTIDGEVGVIEAKDEDTGEFGNLEFSLDFEGSNVGNLPFTIDAKTGIVSTSEALDHESQGEWKLIVTASSGGSSSSTHLTVTVEDINEKPSFVSLDTASVKESASLNQKIASVVISDPDVGDSHTVTVEGRDSDWFKVLDGKLVMAKTGLNFEGMEDHTLQFDLVATDEAGLSHSEQLTLQVRDANDAPTTIRILDVPSVDNTSMTSLSELTEFSEVHPVGVPLAYLHVDDEDAVQEHTFEIVNDPSNKFRISGGNVLVLRDAVDYEMFIRADETPEVSVTLVASDSDDYGTGSLSSLEQTFTLAVTDGVDVPRDFVITMSNGVMENSPAGTKVGTLQAHDQDLENPNGMNMDKFDLSIEGDDFTVGPTTCKAVDNKGTVCSAELAVGSYVVDFESNRVSKDESFVYVKAAAKSAVPAKGTTGEVVCDGMYCPRASVLDENEAPISVAVEGARANSDGSFQVSEGAIILGGLKAVDVDDSCPLDLDGCGDFTPSGAYTFELVSDAEGRFELDGACAEAFSAVERRVKPCNIMASSPLASEIIYSLSVRITDQGGKMSTLPLKIEVAAADVAISIWTDRAPAGVPLVSIEENHIMRGRETVGEVRLSGWVFGTQPNMPRVTKGPFELRSQKGHLAGSSGRRSRSTSAEFSWVLTVETAAIKRETEDMVLELTLDPSTDHEGVVFTQTISISEFIPAKSAATRICENSDCDWVRPSENDASKWVELNAFAEPGFELLAFDTQMVATQSAVGGIVYDIKGESPIYDLYEIIERDNKAILRTVKKPQFVNNANGTIDRSRVTIRARQNVNGELQETERFTVVVAIDYCPEVHPICSVRGTGKCMTVNKSPHYECVCMAGFDGADCSNSVEGLQFESNDSSKDNTMASGMIAVVVILVILCAVLMIAGAAFYKNRNAQSEKEMEAMKLANQILSQEREASAGALPAPFIPGMANRMYDWYDPTASKQQIYEELNVSNPGDFRVRGGDLRNQTFDLHIKTPQNIIVDEKVGKVPGGYKLTGAGREEQPTFPLMPMLIQYYSEVDDPNAPFVLTGADNPIYFAVDESVDVYSNAAIKGSKAPLVNNPLAPSLASKGGVQQEHGAPQLPEKGVAARSEC